MKKIITILLFVLVTYFGYSQCGVVGSCVGTDYIIGTGTSTQSYFPLYSCYVYNYSQQIYTSTELANVGITAGMQINSISFIIIMEEQHMQIIIIGQYI